MVKYDQNIATRFNIFRKTYVAKSMVDAGKIFGCSHSKISDIETAKRPVDFSMITQLAKDYQLNTQWLATGRGPLRINENGDKLQEDRELDKIFSTYQSHRDTMSKNRAAKLDEIAKDPDYLKYAANSLAISHNEIQKSKQRVAILKRIKELYDELQSLNEVLSSLEA